MQSVIEMQDGGRIIHDIVDDKDGVVLFVGRLNFRAGGAFCDRIAALFRECGLAFAQFEPPFEAASRRIDPVGRLHALPPVLHRPIKALHFMARPRASRFLFPAVRQRYQSVAFWEESLLRAVGALPRLPFLLAGYSQGARVATLAGARGRCRNCLLRLPLQKPPRAGGCFPYRASEQTGYALPDLSRHARRIWRA